MLDTKKSFLNLDFTHLYDIFAVFLHNYNFEHYYRVLINTFLVIYKSSISYNINKFIALFLKIQCPPLNRITLGIPKNDNNNRLIQLTDVFCVLLR